ncbi:hypothetical protein D3C72_2575840 [compost metagenome]
MAHAGGDDAHQHLAGLGRGDIHLDDLQRLVGSEGYGGTRLDHAELLGTMDPTPQPRAAGLEEWHEV